MEKNNDLWLERAAYIEKLEADLAAAKAELDAVHAQWNGMREERNEAREQLAARDLVIKQLKDALITVYGCYPPPYGTGEKCVAAREALALQPTTEALDEFVQEQLRSIISQNVIEVQRAKAEWLQQIMARDLVIKQLKDAIDRQPYTMDKGVCEAISLQATTKELDAYVQRAKEEVRDKCAAKCDKQVEYHSGVSESQERTARYCATAIRGMEL